MSPLTTPRTTARPTPRAAPLGAPHTAPGTTSGTAPGAAAGSSPGAAPTAGVMPGDAPDPAAYRAAIGRFPTGVALLTHGSGDDTAAMTLNSLTSVSLDPLLILVSVRSEGRLRPLIAAGGGFAVNVLGEEQRELAREFSSPGRPEGRAAMRRLGAVRGASGHAVLPAAEASIECVLHTAHEAGDHVLFLGRVVALTCGPRASAPLVFHQGRFERLPASRPEAAA
ncbi:flavin reductase family protein [Streptomyces sp. NPDC005805]|uniref:flavin reductase family protein n=1 Tax=Streptomyces sp. NPDC005805 TaxID=3157068 RepID=UPI0033C4BDD5